MLSIVSTLEVDTYMNVTKPRRTRRTHTETFKRSLIEACNEPGRLGRWHRPGQWRQRQPTAALDVILRLPPAL